MIKFFYKLHSVKTLIILVAAFVFCFSDVFVCNKAMAEPGKEALGTSSLEAVGEYSQDNIFYRDPATGDRIMRTPPPQPRQYPSYNPYDGGSIYPEINIYPNFPDGPPTEPWRPGSPGHGWKPGKPSNWGHNPGGNRPGKPPHHGHGPFVRP